MFTNVHFATNVAWHTIVKWPSNQSAINKVENLVTVIYCDVFDWRSSLLGNRSRISSMNTLTTPVLLRYMVTNSRRAIVFIVVGSVKEGKTIHRVSLRQLVFGVSLHQWVVEVRLQCSAVQCSAVPTAGFKKLQYYGAQCNCNLCSSSKSP
jgi:hypothetical protein